MWFFKKKEVKKKKPVTCLLCDKPWNNFLYPCDDCCEIMRAERQKECDKINNNRKDVYCPILLKNCVTNCTAYVDATVDIDGYRYMVEGGYCSHRDVQRWSKKIVNPE